MNSLYLNLQQFFDYFKSNDEQLKEVEVTESIERICAKQLLDEIIVIVNERHNKQKYAKELLKELTEFIENKKQTKSYKHIYNNSACAKHLFTNYDYYV